MSDSTRRPAFSGTADESEGRHDRTNEKKIKDEKKESADAQLFYEVKNDIQGEESRNNNDELDNQSISNNVPLNNSECLRENNNDDSLVVSEISHLSVSSISSSGNVSTARHNLLNFMYTNARSLSPKMDSLIEMFDNLDLHFAAVSETWMSDDRRYENNLRKLEGKENLSMIARNRTGRGGGVAIIFNKSKINLKPVKLKSGKFEVVGGLGRTADDSKKILVFSVYYPPQMKKEAVDKLNDCISSSIDAQKIKHGPVRVIICGDMNNKNIVPILTDHPDTQVLPTPSTRKNETIDLCITSLNIDNIEVTGFPPLRSVTGTLSDHYCIVCFNKEEKRHVFEKNRFKLAHIMKKRPTRSEERLRVLTGLVCTVWMSMELPAPWIKQSVSYSRRIFPSRPS